MRYLSRFKPPFWDHRDASAGPGASQFNLRRKWQQIVAIAMIVTLMPLVVMTLMDCRLTLHAFRSEAMMGTSRIVSNTRRNIAAVLSRHLAVLAFVARDNSLSDLLAPGRASVVLSNLRSGMGGFIDLGVEDAAGSLLAYAGSGGLEQNPTHPSVHFDPTVANGYFISDVQAGAGHGHRLVIALRHDLPGGGFFVLYSTLDAGLLDDPVSQLDLNRGDDAFIIDSRGVLQTPARIYGKRFETVPLAIPPTVGHTRVIRTVDRHGRSVIMGIAPIAGSPFLLMTIRQESGIMDLWLKPRMHLIGFLIFSIALIVVSILGLATYLVNRIHAADQRRIQTLHHLEYANKLASIGRLASGVAHEINNPLAIISQKAGLIKDLFIFDQAYSANEKLMGLLDDVLATVGRCGTITRRLLNFARHMESCIEPVDIVVIIRQLSGLMEKEAERRGILTTTTVEGEIPIFESDRGNIQQIFLNLINNAFAAMADGGRLNITITRSQASEVCVTVADTGHGLSDTDLAHIFEPFFSTRPGHGGTGLGLSVTYGMVSALGGRIAVSSQIGQGTSFTVTLPLNPISISTATAGGATPARSAAADPPIRQEKSI
jgi:two-component system, NtrC family, sensor kinase